MSPIISEDREAKFNKFAFHYRLYPFVAFLILGFIIINIFTQLSSYSVYASSEYSLPYPGILPDHPLYPLKMLRDRVKLLLAFSAEEKSQLLLLYADKRIGAARELVEGNKIDLGVSTALKAEQYLKQTLDEAKIVEDGVLRETLVRAANKHEEVLEGIEESLEDKGKIQEAVDLNSVVRNELE